MNIRKWNSNEPAVIASVPSFWGCPGIVTTTLCFSPPTILLFISQHGDKHFALEAVTWFYDKRRLMSHFIMIVRAKIFF